MFIVLLFVHEMGHFLAARQRGLAVGLPTFIPFVGAWVELKDLPHDAETEAWVGLGGPLLGSVGALGVYFVARETGATWLLVAVITRYSSLAALIAAVVTAIAGWWLLNDVFSASCVTAMSLLLIWRHQANIRKLLDGTEGRIGAGKKSQDSNS